MSDGNMKDALSMIRTIIARVDTQNLALEAVLASLISTMSEEQVSDAARYLEQIDESVFRNNNTSGESPEVVEARRALYKRLLPQAK
ncbi:hypothetical protein PVM12_16715 [Enterobacter soli]|uniref:hypothetical protein n=1 Tax=Enterobacter soli TaxID=885040 RepID=UPI0023791994|nr:hypothetical protein [Enterobacter soli]MDD9245672.1 hypothetical protein [Enterobacter soli]